VKATWCTGKVGMMGTSYNGTLPIAAATTGVQGLECIVPIAPNTFYYGYYRSNGLVRHPGGYMGEDIDVLYDFINSGDPKKREWCTKHVRDGELKKKQDRLTGDLNDFWASRDYLAKVDKMKCAMLMAHAWNDWNVMPEHSVRFFVACKQKGLPCIAFFHQGGHGGQPPKALLNRWFTHFLYGVDNGVEQEAKSWVVREGAKMSDPTPYPDYPHPQAAAVALYPAAGGDAVGALGTEKPKDGKTEKIVDDVNVPGAELVTAASSKHRLLYATPELTEPLHLSGTAKLKLRLASSKPAANVSVWLVSLPWTSKKERINDVRDIITRGWVDPQNRGSLSDSKPLVPGEFVDIAFDLQPDDQVIAKGERIGLMIFSSDRDFTLWPEPGTELTIDLGGTSLELPVVGGANAFAKATAPAAPAPETK
jgi:X-Pro dipeptidyl-peptidase